MKQSIAIVKTYSDLTLNAFGLSHQFLYSTKRVSIPIDNLNSPNALKTKRKENIPNYLDLKLFHGQQITAAVHRYWLENSLIF